MPAVTGIQKQYRKTTFAVGSLAVGTDGDVATASSGAATLNSASGVITSESLATASGADYVLTITNNQVAATDQVLANVSYGSSTTGTPTIARCQPGAGSLVIVVRNLGAAALNGTIKVFFMVVRPLAAASP